MQDHNGFMWFGTNDGLHKYDGYSFTVYRTNSQDSFSINNAEIRDLYQDPSGIIWIATGGGGLNRFDPQTEIFTSYGAQTGSFTCGYVQEVEGFSYDSGFSLWIGTCMALVKYDLSSDTFLIIAPTEDNIWSWPRDYINAMVIDDSGNVWVGCPEGGIHKYDPFKNQYSHYLPDPQNKNSLSSDHILSLAKNQTGNLWIGTQNGLNHYNLVTKKINRFYHDPDNINSLSSNEILSLYNDKSGQLWIGTGNGLNRMDNNTGNFTRYFNNPENTQSIVSNYILSIYEDRSGIIWIGTDQGISKIEPQKQLFNHYGCDPAIPNSLYNKSIMAVCGTQSAGKDYLWLGTRYNGIYKIDRETGKIINYRHDPANPNSISNNWARPWLKSRYKGQDELWIRTRNGLNRLNLDSGKFTHYFHDPNNSNSVKSNEITEIYEDPSGILWITSYRGGLQMFNRETGEFKTIAGKSDIGQVFEDHLGNFWIARWGSLAILNHNTYKQKFYWHRSDTFSTISHPSISVIYQDKAKRLWIGTHGGGLNQYHYESDQFSRYTVVDGLPNGTINGILEDNQGNLWLSTNNGLSKFNPDAHTFTNYDVSDGLLSNQYNHRSCYKSPDGEMFFGSTKGLDAFYPDSILENLSIPTIVLTDFLLFNKPVSIQKNDKQDNVEVFKLPGPISFLDEIEFSYKENIFSIEFSALDYRSPQKNQYAYQMEGVDPEWVYTDASRRFATYTNLDPANISSGLKGAIMTASGMKRVLPLRLLLPNPGGKPI
jgi:ligand-binding sensor domain-containing protein